MVCLGLGYEVGSNLYLDRLRDLAIRVEQVNVDTPSWKMWMMIKMIKVMKMRVEKVYYQNGCNYCLLRTYSARVRVVYVVTLTKELAA